MRDKTELLGMGTTPIVSQARALADEGKDIPPIYNEGELVSENMWEWVLRTIGASFNSLYTPYPEYDGVNNSGIFKIPENAEDEVTIAILGDWASDTIEAHQIADKAKAHDCNYSIHLGDTYFVGKEEEIKANFFPEQGGKWPYGKQGSFALIGNHEMYSGGGSYFTDLLPKMGVTDEVNNPRQQAGFFCLENDYWRVIGLDTGYDSLKGPHRLSQNTELKLPPQLIAWLHNTVKLNDDKRGLIFLSHHQCLSAFEQEFLNPLDSISTLTNPPRDIIWLWGHEHWMSVYGPNQLHNGAKVFARCIGNSGMPVELDVDGGVKRPKSNFPHAKENRNLVMYDQRQREVINGNIRLGHNGYVVLTLAANALAVKYYDDNNWEPGTRLILEEHWTADKETGKIAGQSITDRTIIMGDPHWENQLSLFLGAELNDAIDKPRTVLNV